MLRTKPVATTGEMPRVSPTPPLNRYTSNAKWKPIGRIANLLPPLESKSPLRPL